VFRDGSRHQQVLHITSDSKEKRFDIVPSDYVVDYIKNNIKDEFVYKEVEKVIKVAERKNGQEYLQRVIKPQAQTEIEPCPLCNGKVVYLEGCSSCVECGWSTCVSG